MISIAVPIDSTLSEGKYRWTFNGQLPSPFVPSGSKSIEFFDYLFKLESVEVDSVHDKTIITTSITALHGATGEWSPGTSNTPNVVPVFAAAAVAVIALIGIGLVYLTLDKVERIVDTPGVQVGLVAFGIIAVFALYKYLTHK